MRFPPFECSNHLNRVRLQRTQPESGVREPEFTSLQELYLSFSQSLCVLVADQLERFAKLRNYHLAGHLPNLDFWLSQVRNALAVLDGYGFRFENLKAAQNEYVREHKIMKPGPTRVPSHELNQARRSSSQPRADFSTARS